MEISDICEPIFRSMNREIEPLPSSVYWNNNNNNNNNNFNINDSYLQNNNSSSSPCPVSSSVSSSYSSSCDLNTIQYVVKSKANISNGLQLIHSNSNSSNSSNSNSNSNSSFPPPSSLSSSRSFPSFLSCISLNELKSLLEVNLKKYLSIEYQFQNWSCRVAIFHKDKYVVFSLNIYTESSSNNLYLIEGNLLEGDYNSFQSIFYELKSCFDSFRPQYLPQTQSQYSFSYSSNSYGYSMDNNNDNNNNNNSNNWDSCFSLPEDFLDMELEPIQMSPESFSQNLQPIYSLLNSQYIDMRSEGLQMLLSTCGDSSYDNYFSQLTVNEIYSHYVSCIKSLLNIILSRDSILQINKKNTALALGCLAHLAKYQYTKQYLQSRIDFVSALSNLSNQPLNRIQCQTIQQYVQPIN
mmetsp:Transcript_12572/g.12985  ORF Transcript_12572/g.12985 Transcript_12572/m.12985 type:complete len:409 (+) Transcript_12572:43-1269(+)